jgi:predicted glycoside hydrolase/deacetylase ChbG (UPF0249 family)
MKVIVNADDLGVSTEVNDAIIVFMEQGRVTSSTILANGEAFSEKLVARIARLSSCSFGVHLNASQFAPLTRDPDLKPILDENGCFAGNKLREIKITRSLKAALYKEWCAQVEHVRSAGVQVSHLDSHHHMHTVPTIFQVLKQVQRSSGIRRVRQTMNIYSLHSPIHFKLKIAKAFWNTALRHYYSTRTTDGFTSLSVFHSVASAGRMPPRLNTVELMVHPGGAGYEVETSQLGTEWWRDLPYRIGLISYNQI